MKSSLAARLGAWLSVGLVLGVAACGQKGPLMQADGTKAPRAGVFGPVVPPTAAPEAASAPVQ